MSDIAEKKDVFSDVFPQSVTTVLSYALQALGVSPFMLLSDGVMRPVTVLSYVVQVIALCYVAVLRYVAILSYITMFSYVIVVLVGVVAWMQKDNTTVFRNILLVRDRSTFHEKNQTSAESWCHSFLFPLYEQVDPRAVENVCQLK